MKQCPKLKNSQLTIENAILQKSYIIKYVNENLSYKYTRRLYELGFIPNEKIEVLRKSLQRKTFLVAIRGVVFSLQKELASQIVLEAI